MRNRENYNEIVKFVKKEAKDTKKQGYFVYDILDFLIEAEENLVNGNSKIANQIYNDEIEYKKGDNSYNWCSNINNDINYLIYEINDEIYIKLKVHEFGDIRNHYTDEIILKFDTEYEFYELLSDATRFYTVIKLNAGKAFLSCDIFDEIIDVNIEKNENDIFETNSSEIDFCLYDTIDEIKEKLNKYFKK